MNGGLKDKILLIFQILGSFSYPKYWHAAIQSLFILLLMIIQQMRNKCIQLLFINGHKLNMNPIWLHLFHTVMSKRHHYKVFSIWTNDTSEIPRPTSKSDQIKTKPFDIFTIVVWPIITRSTECHCECGLSVQKSIQCWYFMQRFTYLLHFNQNYC